MTAVRREDDAMDADKRTEECPTCGSEIPEGGFCTGNEHLSHAPLSVPEAYR